MYQAEILSNMKAVRGYSAGDEVEKQGCLIVYVTNFIVIFPSFTLTPFGGLLPNTYIISVAVSAIKALFKNLIYITLR